MNILRDIQHTSLYMVEILKKNLDHKKLNGIDCLSHEIDIAKLNAYGLSTKLP